MTVIMPDDESIAQLQKLIEPPETLAKNGYTMQPLTEDELLLRRRCIGCGKTMTSLRPREKRSRNNDPPVQPGSVDSSRSDIAHSQRRDKRPPNNGPSPQPEVAHNPLSGIARSQPTIKEVVTVMDDVQKSEEAGDSALPEFRCKFHSGQVVQQIWTCCDKSNSAGKVPPCGGMAAHIPQNITTSVLAQNYQFRSTPSVYQGQRHPRIAVALDCEMGTAVSGDSEPIRITLVDYFSGAILVNKFIYPDVPMAHLNTKYSGVTWQDLNIAKRQQTCLRGNAGAREAIWKYVGVETIVVGHGVNNDLRTLRWIHEAIVDSQMLEHTRAKRAELKETEEKRIADKKEVELKGVSKVASGDAESLVADAPKAMVARKPPGQLSLKTLVKLRLGRDIQMGGKKGHDSLEDAVAARDLVHWNIMNPDEEVMR